MEIKLMVPDESSKRMMLRCGQNYDVWQVLQSNCSQLQTSSPRVTVLKNNN